MGASPSYNYKETYREKRGRPVNSENIGSYVSTYLAKDMSRDVKKWIMHTYGYLQAGITQDATINGFKAQDVIGSITRKIKQERRYQELIKKHS